MYILIVAAGYPTSKYKLNGIFEFDQALALAKTGHKVVYAAVDLHSVRRWRKWGFQSLENEGVFVETINLPWGRFPRKKVGKWGFAKLYKRIVKRHGVPDIIHAHFIFSGYLVAEHLRQTNIPLILTEHLSSMNQETLSPYYMRLGEATYRHMDKVLAVSNHLSKNILQKFGVESEIVPNILATDIFSYEPIKKSEELFYFVSVGSLIPDKRIKFLVEKFIQCFRDDRSTKLYIFGEGSDERAIEALINKKGVKDQVFLLGTVGRDEIAEKFRESDCFVLLSKHETFGVAYIEALASGLPVIATRCGGPEDFVDESNGILVGVDNEAEIEKALKKMRYRETKFDRERISKEAIKKFSSEAIAERLSKIYEAVIRTKNHHQ